MTIYDPKMDNLQMRGERMRVYLSKLYTGMLATKLLASIGGPPLTPRFDKLMLWIEQRYRLLDSAQVISFLDEEGAL